MLSCNSYKVFENIYFTEHLLVIASVFCIFFYNFGYKSILNNCPVFRKQ